MNTKKIWIIALILGLVLTIFVYLTIFSPNKDTTVDNVKVAKQTTVTKSTVSKRDFTNSIVEVSKGKRAISIKVDTAQGVSGYVAPNSKVDVIAYETTKDAARKEYRNAVLILENVKVLTSGKSADNKAEALNYQTVTLEVTPEQGVTLSLASKDKDGFYLMLRNSKDKDIGKAGIKQTREVLQEGGS